MPLHSGTRKPRTCCSCRATARRSSGCGTPCGNDRTLYAERLGQSAADMQRSMRHLERLVDGAVQQREDMAKVAIRSLAHRLQRMVPDVARIVGRHEARTQALYELVDGLKKLIEQWRRL